MNDGSTVDANLQRKYDAEAEVLNRHHNSQFLSIAPKNNRDKEHLSFGGWFTVCDCIPTHLDKKQKEASTNGSKLLPPLHQNRTFNFFFIRVLLKQLYWRAPLTTFSTELIIVLGSLFDVSGVIILVSPCGYSMSDSFIVQIWASNKIHKEERPCVGKWDVKSMLTSSSELCGPEECNTQMPRHIKFDF
ncbi:unnamed protein product [Lactuca saligna]|uniref:SAC9 second GBDL domain-containing protein n=1 Tax=Lactuca saligna TaxID=75948 RepID=A0AA35Y7R2_LACSI|nr:unnamed protein product [Lactuca saligna]